MREKISRFLGKIWNFLLALFVLASLGLNLYFIWSRGIEVNYHHQQEQVQNQVQLIMTPFASSGKVKWVEEKVNHLEDHLNRLSPEQAFFSKVKGNRLVYPVIVSEEKIEIPEESKEGQKEKETMARVLEPMQEVLDQPLGEE